VHRAQITFDYVDLPSGEVTTGQIRPATRPVLRQWLARFHGHADVAFAVEGCTGWRFVVEELLRAGVAPHLAEPADTASQRGRKKRAKTDRADARLLRDLLVQRRLPESWIPPSHILEVRSLGRLYVTLMDERRAWQQRIHAQLFHHGVPAARGLLTRDGRASVANAEVSPAGRQVLQTAMAAIDSLTEHVLPLKAQLQAIGAQQPAVLALTRHVMASGYCRAPSSGPSWAIVGASRTPTRRCASPAWISRCGPRLPSARPDALLDRDRPNCAGRCSKPPRPRPATRHQTTPITTPCGLDSEASSPPCRWRAGWRGAVITRCANWMTRPGCPRLSRSGRPLDVSRECAPCRPIQLMHAASSCTLLSSPHGASVPGRMSGRDPGGHVAPIHHHVAARQPYARAPR
jgi:hypothetical protein